MNEQDAKSQIRQILSGLPNSKKLNIEFEVISEKNLMKCGQKVVLYDDSVCSGSGTLGCFVIHTLSAKSRDKSLCLLTARHVLNPNTTCIEYPNSLPVPICEKYPDITIEKLNRNLCISCEVGLKDLDKRKHKASVCCSKNIEQELKKRHESGKSNKSDDLCVFFWGAVTKPGHGKLDYFYIDKEDNHYFLVKENEIKTFASVGDSGSIVCLADKKHPFKALGLLVSAFENLENEIVGYKVIPLDTGLEYLRSVYRGEIDLCTPKHVEELRQPGNFA